MLDNSILDTLINEREAGIFLLPGYTVTIELTIKGVKADSKSMEEARKVTEHGVVLNFSPGHIK